MNSTTVAATAPALTTPFVVPASCTDSFNTTLTYRTGLDGDATHVTVYAAFPQTTSGCQASGANVHRDGATIVVRPGVCPSNWVAYNLKVDGPQYYPNPSDAASVTFDAVCCSRCVLGQESFICRSSLMLKLLKRFLCDRNRE